MLVEPGSVQTKKLHSDSEGDAGGGGSSGLDAGGIGGAGA